MKTLERKTNHGRNDPCPCGAQKENNLPKKYKHCCLFKNQNYMKNQDHLREFFRSNPQNLKTLPDELNGKNLCLDMLFKILESLTSQKFIRDLAFIGKAFDKDSLKNAHDSLIQKYASLKMKEDLLKDSKENFLFNRFAIKVVDELLRIRREDRSIIFDAKSKSQVEYLGLTQEFFESRLKSIEGVFLIANTLIPWIENQNFSPTEDDAKTRIFLSRRATLKPSAVGKSRIYLYEGLSDRLKSIDLNIEHYLKSVFSLCAHLENQSVLELDLSSSLNGVKHSSEILIKYINLLTSDVFQSSLSGRSSLSKLYYTDELCRQKPLLRVDERLYCLQPGLLWAAFADLPFYLLLDSYKSNKKMGDELWQLHGRAFEKNWRDLGSRVFNPENCKDYECSRKHPDLNFSEKHRIGDLLVSLSQDGRAIFEFKGAVPDDSIRQGSKTKLLSKFINLEDGDGVPQLCKDTIAYRREASFNGAIYIILAIRGPFPLTSDFDSEFESYLKGCPEYQSFLLNTNNKPLICVDEECLELIFSSIRQGISAEEVFQSLAGALPSKVPKIIFDQVEKNQLKFSSIELFREEIMKYVEMGRSFFI